MTKTIRLLSGKRVSVLIVEGIREAQREGWRIDVDLMEAAEVWARLTLLNVVVDYRLMRRMEARQS